MLRLILTAALLSAPAASLAQAIDPAAVAQSGVIRGTMEGHAERNRAESELGRRSRKYAGKPGSAAHG